ncbi:hypothetical protein AAFC00_004232 [Neodothiora populina]|uniref:nicotinamidase n=1 Tax=Neodothiora populina TaxID=2781224 RepID=A0ABR3PJ03_9PEZI
MLFSKSVAFAVASIISSAVAVPYNPHLHKNTALVIIDVQNDFVNGSLGSLRAPAILPQLYRLLDKHDWPLIIASQDWHPSDHVSFYTSHPGKASGDTVMDPFVADPTTKWELQTLYTPHCVPETWGSELENGISTRLHNLEGFRTSVNYIKKAQNHTVDSYSAFADNQHYQFTTLQTELHAHGIERIVIGGLVTNACVRGTSIDGIKLGFEVILLEDATEAPTQQLKDDTIAELKGWGVTVMKTKEWEAKNRV